MRKLLCFLMFIYGTISFGQKMDSASVAEFINMSNDFKNINDKYLIEKEKLEQLKKNINLLSNPDIGLNIKKQIEENQKIYNQLDSTYLLFLNYKKVYLNKKISEKTIDSLFSHQHILSSQVEKTESLKTYFFFGDKKVIDEKDNIFKDENVSAIFDEILNAKSESYLGDFSIPKKGEKIEYQQVYRKTKGLWNLSQYEVQKYLYFKAIKMHAFEGSLVDIRLFVTDDNNNEYVFQNKIATSLLKLSRLSHNDFLFLKPIKINGKDIEVKNNENIKLKFYRIKLSDVLEYTPNPGNNYVPEDEIFDFPLIKDGILTNENAPAKYKVISDSSLQNTVELRTYTDFLALFGNAPNGIVQIEGKADFFVSPFNLPHTNLFLFKKITPYVAFSKIESDVRNLTLESVNATTSKIKQSLEILEKSYLRMGLNLNVATYKFTKEFPFDIGVFGTARYLIADLSVSNSLAVNYKSFGYGGGATFEFKRYNNFGFIYSAELTKYDANSFNVIEGIQNPDNFLTFKNEAEVYYYPNNSKSQAVFLRFKTFSNSTTNNNEAFYQLQFGYRFAIGVNSIKQ